MLEVVLDSLYQIKDAIENLMKWNQGITDMNDFPKVNEIYASYFAEPFPARSCVGVASLPKGALVEIEVVASLG